MTPGLLEHPDNRAALLQISLSDQRYVLHITSPGKALSLPVTVLQAEVPHQ